MLFTRKATAAVLLVLGLTATVARAAPLADNSEPLAQPAGSMEVLASEEVVQASDAHPIPRDQNAAKDTISMRLLLKTNKIIPDVLDDFVGSVEISLVDGRGFIPAGSQVLVSEETAEPNVTLPLSLTTKQYTLVMTDPGVMKETPTGNVRAPANENAWQYLHWIVVNIPGAAISEGPVNGKGDVLVPYAGPNPPQGNHRYAFILFEQEQNGLKLTPPEERGAWNTRAFMKANKLKPVGGMFYLCQPGKTSPSA